MRRDCSLGGWRWLPELGTPKNRGPVQEREATMTLQMRNVSKTYPNGVQALKNVTLAIPAGMYGLLGPNGAGKSTLMRILATLQEADEGSVTLGALDVLRRKDEVRKTLGYLPQEFGVYPKVSAGRLLTFGED